MHTCLSIRKPVLNFLHVKILCIVSVRLAKLRLMDNGHSVSLMAKAPWVLSSNRTITPISPLYAVYCGSKLARY